MHSIRVELTRDPSGASFYRATDQQGRAGESDHVPEMDVNDVHGLASLAAQSVGRLGQRILAAR